MPFKKQVLYFTFFACLLSVDKSFSQTVKLHPKTTKNVNPLMTGVNIPVDYAKVSPGDLEAYAGNTLRLVTTFLKSVKTQKVITFANVFEAMDNVYNRINTTSNTCFMFYWVSTDSLSRAKGLEGYQLMDSLSTSIFSDKGIYNKMLAFKSSPAYNELKGTKKTLVDEFILSFQNSGVNLDETQLQNFKTLTKEINDLSTQYAGNMNSSKDMLSLDEEGVKGLPEAFRNNYKVAEGKYEIPIINSTNETVMGNAVNEATRKAYFIKFNNRAADKNLAILDSMIKKRDALAKVMGYNSFADYSLVSKMAKDPQTVWPFINDLVKLTTDKAKADVALFENGKKAESKTEDNAPLQPWDIAYYKNQLLKNKYSVNNEELREYFPMEKCLKGMFDIYQKLLGLQFKKVNNPSVWHGEVEMYEVYEGEKLKGRFYLDLFPRPNKETWFYGVNIISGKGNEIPVSMLLGNFTRPTKTQPSLLSQKELNTLFHEFGHIMNMMAYHGDYSYLSNSKADFVESMSQMFENWIWDYDMLGSFAKHYSTGKVLPKATFDNMLKTKNVGSALSTITAMQKCMYDMNLYNKYDAAAPLSTDELWKKIDRELGVMNFYAEGTHPQASWIHINTHPVYYYGYTWSRVYAQDMFTQFEKNGLLDTKTGKKYRELILANGIQRDIVEAVKEFLGRTSDNKAYIKSLGLE